MGPWHPLRVAISVDIFLDRRSEEEKKFLRRRNYFFRRKKFFLFYLHDDSITRARARGIRAGGPKGPRRPLQGPWPG